MALFAFRSFFILVLQVNFIVFCEQQYRLKHDIMELNYYNIEYFRNLQLTLFWYNRTTRAYNMSTYLKQDLGFNIKFNGTVYKSVNNQYCRYPKEFRKNVCDMLENNVFGFQDITNFTNNVTSCPIFKGYYKITNLILDTDKFPRYLLPFGSYKVHGGLYDWDMHLTTTSWYGEVLSVNP